MRLRIIQTPSPVGAVVYRPADDPPLGGIVVLHGSEGGSTGWNDLTAALFAAHGFAAMAKRYTESDALLTRPDIDHVPLDGTEQALSCLRELLAPFGSKVALYGTSRGAEHALLLTQLLAEEQSPALPDAVAVHAPHRLVCPAFILGHYQTDPPTPADWTRPAWTWRGSTERTRPGTPIAVERYDGPLFISHGEADQVWPADETRALARRLRDAGREPEIHYFGGEGHVMRAAARNRLLDLLLSFLERSITRRS